VCTHLGCVVPWNQAEKKFICPCHGSQYNDQGRVVRGPAPLVSQTEFSQRISYFILDHERTTKVVLDQQLLTVYLIFDFTLINIQLQFYFSAQSLALAHCDVDDGKVVFVPWVETDFRTGDDPWWT